MELLKYEELLIRIKSENERLNLLHLHLDWLLHVEHEEGIFNIIIQDIERCQDNLYIWNAQLNRVIQIQRNWR